MVARSDPANYGKLEVFDVSSATGSVTGPMQFDANTLTDADITRQLTLLNTEGSRVRAGNLLLIPIENTLVYVRPIYVEATTATALPRLQQVIVGVGEDLAMRATFAEALDAVIPGLGASDVIDQGGPEPGGETPTTEPPTTGPTTTGPPTSGPSTTGPPTTGPTTSEATGDGGGETPGTDVPSTLDDLLLEADVAFSNAEQALASGDLGEYQRQVDRARDALERARTLLNVPPTAPAPSEENEATTTTQGGQSGAEVPTSAPVGEA
jgi:uncharacterized protein